MSFPAGLPPTKKQDTLRLYLLRHAKSEWDNPADHDHDRPLAQRGIKSARKIGEYLHNQQVDVDMILCSTALRTRQTLSLARSMWKTNAPTHFDRTYYLSGYPEILQTIRKIGTDHCPSQQLEKKENLPETIRKVLYIGHNPDIEMLAYYLAEQCRGEDALNIKSKYPTGGFSSFTIHAQGWNDITPAVTVLNHFIRPKDIL